MTSNKERTGKEPAGKINNALPYAINLGLFSRERKIAQIWWREDVWIACFGLHRVGCRCIKKPARMSPHELVA